MSWSVQINGYDEYSWKGYDPGACDGFEYYFSDCINRVIDKCTDYQFGAIAEGTCTNAHTKEVCKFKALDDIRFPVPFDDIKCPSCNASRASDPSTFALCSPDNAKCFDHCKFDTCINNLPAPYLFGCQNPMIKECEARETYAGYGISHVSGTCTNPQKSETCQFEIDCDFGEISSCSPKEFYYLNPVTTTVNCSTFTAKQVTEGDVSGNGCSSVDCLPDCNHGKHHKGEGTARTKWIIVGTSVGVGVLLAVTSAAIIIYKCTHRAGYQQISEN
ncbi:hypothetical protein [Endozoicomonas sp. 2B-B]